MSETLFDADLYRRNYRKGDPMTSVAAGISISLRSGSQRRLLLGTYADDTDPEGLTSWDVGQRSGLAERDGCCWWKRVSELAAAGLIEQVGTRMTPTGQSQTAYIITSAGRSALLGEVDR